MPSTPPQSRHRGCRGAHRRDPGGLFLRRRRNAVAVGGTFQFHSPGGQTEIIYAEEERAPLPDFSDPSLMEEGLPVTGDGPFRPFNRCPHRGYIADWLYSLLADARWQDRPWQHRARCEGKWQHVLSHD